MAAWRSGVADLGVTDAHLGTWGAIVRRYAATLAACLVWVAISVACVAAWFGIIYGVAWLAG